MNYIDKNIKTINEYKIIMVKKNNKFYIEYCFDDRIIAGVYEIVI